MPKHHYISDYCSMEDEDMSHASYRSTASSVRSGPPSYGGNYDMNQRSSSGTPSRQQFVPQQQQMPFGQTASSSFVGSSEVTDSLSLKRDREREGRCSECGVQTHEFRIDPMTGRHVKVPMTVDREVHRGRCLLCHPIPLSCEQSSSTRSMTTISTLGNSSAPGNYPQQQQQHQQQHYHPLPSHQTPDPVESASIVTSSSSVVQDTLQAMQDESCDLLELLTAMRRFPTERRIQERGLEKLWIQSWDDDNSIAIGRVGGIATILRAMNAFAAHPKLQQYGCEALQNLALNEYNRDFMSEHGGIQAVVQAMNRHRAVVGVQQAGCTALANLATTSTREHQLDIANAGGLHAIIHAAQMYADVEHVLRASYQALRAMGYDPQRHGAQAQEEQQQQEHEREVAMQEDEEHHQDDNDDDDNDEVEQAQSSDRQGQQPQHDNNSSGGRGQQQGSGNVIRLDAYGFPI